MRCKIECFFYSSFVLLFTVCSGYVKKLRDQKVWFEGMTDTLKEVS